MGAHRLTVHSYVCPGRDEVPGAELGGLGPGDGLDDRVEGDPVPRPQGPQILLLAVGGDDRGAARAVEEGEQFVVRGRAARIPGEAAHGPHLEHGGRRDGVRPGVRRTGVAQRLAPVPDHRHVDGILADTADDGGAPFERGEPLGELIDELIAGRPACLLTGWGTWCVTRWVAHGF